MSGGMPNAMIRRVWALTSSGVDDPRFSVKGLGCSVMAAVDIVSLTLVASPKMSVLIQTTIRDW
jgi:hypothetical protein